MSDNIDALRIEIIYDDKASKGLEGLIGTLERLKSFSNADSGIKTLEQSVSQANSGMTEMNTTLQEVIASSNKVVQPLKDAGKTSSGIDKVTSAFKQMPSALQNATKRTTGLFAAIKRVAVYRAIRSLLKHITQAFSEGISNVYQYSKAVGGDLANSFDRVSSSMAQFKNSIGAAVAPLLQTLAPVIDFIVQKLIVFMNVLSQLFAKLSGKSTWLKAVGYTKEFASSAGSAGKAVKELKATLLGIDEINVMQAPPSGTSGGGGGGTSPVQMFEEVELSPAFDKLKLTLKDIEWYVGAIGAGLVAWKIGGLLKSITDGKIGIKEMAGMAFTVTGSIIFAKGFKDALEDELNSKNLLEMVSGGGLAAGGLFLINFNAGLVGLGTAGLGIALAGMNDQVENGVNTMNTIAKVGGLGVLGTVAGFFLLGGPIGAVIGGGLGVIAGSVDTLWNQISEDWDFWSEYIKNATKETWGNISGQFKNAWNGIKGVFSGTGEWFSGVWSSIKKAFSSVSDWFKDTFSKAWTAVKNVFSSGGKVFDGIKDGILNGLKSVVNSLIRGINKVISIPFNGLNTALQKIRDVSVMGIKPFSFVHQISVPRIPALADGGQVNSGQLFVAREAGAELVGTIGGKTSVANNQQITEGITEGVTRANVEQNALLREQNSLLRQMLEKEGIVQAVISTSNIVDGLSRKNRRDGLTTVPVGR